MDQCRFGQVKPRQQGQRLQWDYSQRDGIYSSVPFYKCWVALPLHPMASFYVQLWAVALYSASLALNMQSILGTSGSPKLQKAYRKQHLKCIKFMLKTYQRSLISTIVMHKVHGILLCPTVSGGFVFGFVGLEYATNFRNKWIANTTESIPKAAPEMHKVHVKDYQKSDFYHC